jgi:predicted dehydrogenase
MTRVAIIGSGWGTRVQVPIFRQEGLEIAALWAHSTEKAQRIAGDLSIPFASADYRAILARPDVDLVSITTPPHTHAEMVITALEAGKHVLCEKPTALDLKEAERMLAAAEAHPQQLSLIDHQLRFLPSHQRMKTLIREGYVGQVFYIEATALEGAMLDPGARWHWWHERAKGGGRLGAIGSHLIDLTAWLLDRPVTAVDGALRTFMKERADTDGITRPVTSDDFFLLRLQLNGADAFLEGSSVAAGQRVHRVMIIGSLGSLRYEVGQLIGYRQDTGEQILAVEDVLVPPPLHQNPFTLGTVYLGRALRAALEYGERARLQPAATFADGFRVQRILAGAHQSSDDGIKIRLDEV